MQREDMLSEYSIEQPPTEGYLPCLGHRRWQCSSCGASIFDGEFYYLLSGDPYCEDCVRRLDASELADALGYPEISFLIEVLGGKYRRD